MKIKLYTAEAYARKLIDKYGIGKMPGYDRLLFPNQPYTEQENIFLHDHFDLVAALIFDDLVSL